MATPSVSRIERHHVLGELTVTGSRDPDVLFATKRALLEPVKSLRIIGLWSCIAGGLATLFLLTAFLGIPLIAFGWWALRRGKRNLKTIDATYAEYLDSLGSKEGSRSERAPRPMFRTVRTGRVQDV